MKRILLAACGGTIGSEYANGKIDVAANRLPPVITAYNSFYKDAQTKFDVITPINRLSENILPEDWSVIYKEIMRADLCRYNGVIITCGTDTLCYTAAAMGFLLYHIGIPVVVVAADYPVSDSRSNGLHNFKDAVEFIGSFLSRGVFVSFRNNGESNINLATRINPLTNFTHLCLSAGEHNYGYIKDEVFIQNHASGNPNPENFPKESWANDKEPAFCSGILGITGYPSLDYRSFCFEHTKPKAVLHSLYHSSTACTRGEYTSVIEFAIYCKEQGVPLYIAPYESRQGRYVTDHQMIENGAIPVYDTTFCAALVKLMLAYGTFDDEKDIRSFIDSNIFFEKILFLH